jgi:hypothetical protein
LLPPDSNDLSIKVPCDREVVRVVTDRNQKETDFFEFDCFEMSDPVQISLGVLDSTNEELQIKEEEINQIPDCGTSGDESTNSIVDLDQGGDEQAREQGSGDLRNLRNAEWKVIIRTGVNSCLNSLLEAQKARSSKCLLVHACDRAAVLCARILAAWRWAKEQGQSASVMGDWERVNQTIGVKLLNISDNCYINALIQGLFYLLPVRELISSWPGNQSVAAHLRSVFVNLVEAHLISPAFLGEICEPEVDGAEDCCEFALSIFSALRNDLNVTSVVALERLICFQWIPVVITDFNEERFLDEESPMLTLFSSGHGSLIEALEAFLLLMNYWGGSIPRGDFCFANCPIFFH